MNINDKTINFFDFGKEKREENIKNEQYIKNEDIDIWKLLNIMRTKNLKILDNYPETEKEKILDMIIVLMKWLSNPINLDIKQYTNNISLINDLVNKNFWNIYTDKENNNKDILFYCLCIATSKNKSKLKWIPFKKQEKQKEIYDIIKEIYPLLSEDEMDIIIKKIIKLYGKENLVKSIAKKNEQNYIKTLLNEIDEIINK